MGERVVNAGSPPYTSDGVVSSGDWANSSLSLYNAYAGVTVQRFRIRYANHAINDYSPGNTHTVQYCRLENCNVVERKVVRLSYCPCSPDAEFGEQTSACPKEESSILHERHNHRRPSGRQLGDYTDRKGSGRAQRTC